MTDASLDVLPLKFGGDRPRDVVKESQPLAEPYERTFLQRLLLKGTLGERPHRGHDDWFAKQAIATVKDERAIPIVIVEATRIYDVRFSSKITNQQTPETSRLKVEHVCLAYLIPLMCLYIGIRLRITVVSVKAHDAKLIFVSQRIC